MYLSPLNLDPREPAMPISSPPGYAAELVGVVGGLYHTLGMAEETWSLNEGHMDDAGYLAMIDHPRRAGGSLLTPSPAATANW